MGRRLMILAAIVILASGCDSAGIEKSDSSAPLNRSSASNSVHAWSFFSQAIATLDVSSCSGRVKLSGGIATVKDSCFSGETNVVVCTDNTAANPVRCAPGAGKLSIGGVGEDVISYARLR